MEQIKKLLSEVISNNDSRDAEKILRSIESLKQDAVNIGDQVLAKELWCSGQILLIQEKFVEAFKHLKKMEFYKGWCCFERVELELHFLEPHFNTEDDTYMLAFIKKHTEQFQSLFPYKIFMSSEILEKAKECNICNQRVSIRKPCGHKVGDIYNGEMCIRVVTDCEFLGVAMVENPVNRYSVPFIKDPVTGETVDQYNYTAVSYASVRLASPFHGWDVEWTKAWHPHSRYKHIGRNDKCPCESEKKYKHCCMNEVGVLRPHCDITFLEPLPMELMTIEYTN